MYERRQELQTCIWLFRTALVVMCIKMTDLDTCTPCIMTLTAGKSTQVSLNCFHYLNFWTRISQVPPNIRFILPDICKPLYMSGFETFNWLIFIKFLWIVFYFVWLFYFFLHRYSANNHKQVPPSSFFIWIRDGMFLHCLTEGLIFKFTQNVYLKKKKSFQAFGSSLKKTFEYSGYHDDNETI